MAAATRDTLSGAVFHSDHGALYTSRKFADLCGPLGIAQSMCAVGTSADNAACESFHAALKRETLCGVHHYPGAELCRRAVFRWLTRYNTRLRHSANGPLSPVHRCGYDRARTSPLAGWLTPRCGPEFCGLHGRIGGIVSDRDGSWFPGVGAAIHHDIRAALEVGAAAGDGCGSTSRPWWCGHRHGEA